MLGLGKERGRGRDGTGKKWGEKRKGIDGKEVEGKRFRQQ